MSQLSPSRCRSFILAVHQHDTVSLYTLCNTETPGMRLNSVKEALLCGPCSQDGKTRVILNRFLTFLY
jgi:hypothetical protein